MKIFNKVTYSLLLFSLLSQLVKNEDLEEAVPKEEHVHDHSHENHDHDHEHSHDHNHKHNHENEQSHDHSHNAEGEENFDPQPYVEELNKNLEEIASEEMEAADCSKHILQAYSMKPMDEINVLINSEEKESELDEGDQNLLYFYWLIKDFFIHHKEKTVCNKSELKDYILSNEIVNYLDELLQKEQAEHEEEQGKHEQKNDEEKQEITTEGQ